MYMNLSQQETQLIKSYIFLDLAYHAENMFTLLE